MTDRPLVTVLIPIWRLDAELFVECVNSLVRQSYPRTRLQVVVCFDGTPDAEVRTATAVLKSSPLSWHSVGTAANRGMAHARNLCAAAAAGDWLVLLDHDDRFAPDALTRLTDAVEDGVELVYADYEQVTRGGEVLFRSDLHPFHELLLTEGVDVTSPIWHATHILQPMLINRKAFWRCLGFDVGAGLAHEVDLRIKLFNGKNFRYVADSLYRYVQRPGSVYHTRHAELVADTCATLLKHYQGNFPDAVSCRRLGKLGRSSVTAYGFFDRHDELLGSRTIDYRSLTPAGAVPSNDVARR